MMPMGAMSQLHADAIMFNTKLIKRRNPVAFDLLLSGTYKQRKVKSKRDYKRNFKNQKEYELTTSY